MSFLIAAFGVIRGVAGVMIGVITELLGSRAGQLLLVALVAFALGYRHANNTTQNALAAQRIAFEKRVALETQRRDFAIKTAAQQARNDAQEIQELEDRLAAAQKESDHASHAHDRHPGLSADGVRRLNRLR